MKSAFCSRSLLQDRRRTGPPRFRTFRQKLTVATHLDDRESCPARHKLCFLPPSLDGEEVEGEEEEEEGGGMHACSYMSLLVQGCIRVLASATGP